MRYIGVSTAAQISIYYNTFTPMCTFDDVEYGQEITCSITSASDMVDRFQSITYFSIEYADGIYDNMLSDRQCIGFIDTSCEYDIAGTRSLECQYLQIVQYIHSHDQVCSKDDDDVADIAELLPQMLSAQRKWEYIAEHSESSESYSSDDHFFGSDSRRRLLQLPDGYYTVGDTRIDIKLCDDFDPESSDDSSSQEKHEIYQSIVCVTYHVRKLVEQDCGELERIFLPFCNGNEHLSSSNDIDELIVSISPQGVTADGLKVKIEPDLFGIVVSLHSSAIDSFELCLRNVSVESKQALVDIETVDIAPFAGLVVHDEYAFCNNSDGLPCLNFLPSDGKNSENDQSNDDDDLDGNAWGNEFGDIVLQNNNALMMNDERSSTEEALRAFDRMSLSLRLILICIGVGIVAGLITVCCICCVHVYYQWMNEMQNMHALHRQRVIKLNPVTSDSCVQPSESVTLHVQHQSLQQLMAPAIDEHKEEEYDLDHAVSPMSSISDGYGEALCLPQHRQQYRQQHMQRSVDYDEDDDDEVVLDDDDTCVATTYQSDSIRKQKFYPGSWNTSTKTIKSGEEVRNSNPFSNTEDLGSEEEEEEEYEDEEEEEDDGGEQDIQYNIYLTLI